MYPLEVRCSIKPTIKLNQMFFIIQTDKYRRSDEVDVFTMKLVIMHLKM
jgi:hypothetical protein